MAGHTTLQVPGGASVLLRLIVGLCVLSALVGPQRLCAEAPNIVFILADDLGYTDIGCYGTTYYETPNIDRMARDGMRFTDGYTCGPNCQPTRAALMSGQYGPRTGVYTVGSIERFDWRSRTLRPVDNVTGLSPETVTVAEALKEAGYVTGMFGKWHLGRSADEHPAKQGFDEAIVSNGRHFNFRTDPKTDHDKDEYLADFLTDRAVDFIQRHRDEPFFLYLPHFAVHSPYHAKKDLIAKYKQKEPVNGHNDPVYAAMIASVDESVGRVLDTLDKLDLSENTLVIFSSDNGGVGGYQREGIQARDTTDNRPLRGGKGMLYEGGIRVPYIFRQPGTVAAGTTCDEPINSVDLFPTLVDLAGGDIAGLTLDGVSYTSLLHGGKTLDRDAIYWHFPGYLGSKNNTWRTLPVSVVRKGDWKLLHFLEDNRLELYNLRDGVGEKGNLAAKMPEKVSELREDLAAWQESVGAKMPTPNKPTKGKRGKKKSRKPNKS